MKKAPAAQKRLKRRARGNGSSRAPTPTGLREISAYRRAGARSRRNRAQTTLFTSLGEGGVMRSMTEGVLLFAKLPQSPFGDSPLTEGAKKVTKEQTEGDRRRPTV